MPSRQIARLPAYISRPAQADISISPDHFVPWPFSRSQTTGVLPALALGLACTAGRACALFLLRALSSAAHLLQ